MAEGSIPYDSLVRTALLSMIRGVMKDAEDHGFPGDHHFYIAFDTSHPGVEMAAFLKAQYPEEMVIVLQHRFWNLTVGEDHFSVELTFSGVRQMLLVPFDAINTFSDPSVNFGLSLKFVEDEGAPHANESDWTDSGLASLVPAVLAPDDGIQNDADGTDKHPDPAPKEAKAAPADDEADGETKTTGEVVSLDAFRKR
ncbi:MAG: ClpXP protease specificity-enhancing factor SspB [Pseudomonadota bacterium]